MRAGYIAGHDDAHRPLFGQEGDIVSKKLNAPYKSGPLNSRGQISRATGFYAIILTATVVGFALGFTSLDPIKMLVWSAVLNGIVSVPVMAMMMVLITSPSVMGRFRAHRWLAWVGWSATALMGFIVTALMLASLIGN